MADRAATAPGTGRKTLWAWALGTFFGAGLLKPGPGTWGSAAAVLLWKVVEVLSRPYGIAFPSATDPNLHLGYSALPSLTFLAALLATAIGIPAATIVARESGREDPGHVVIDEVAWQWLTLALCKPDWAHALLALGLFRLFDITKPWPIRKLERLPAGWGIMLDDLGAGLYATVVLVLIQHWW